MMGGCTGIDGTIICIIFLGISDFWVEEVFFEKGMWGLFGDIHTGNSEYQTGLVIETRGRCGRSVGDTPRPGEARCARQGKG